MKMNLNYDIQYVKGVGESRARLFRRIGIGTVGDLLRFYPRAYEDWSRICSPMNAPEGEICCVRGTLAYPPETRRIAGDRIMVKTALVDEGAFLDIVFFNNKYVADKLTQGEKYLFFGKPEKDPYGGGLQMVSPQFQPVSDEGEGLHPIYRQTEKLNTRAIAKCVRTVLDSVGELPDPIPADIIRKYRLLPLREALEKIHFPRSEEDIHAARRRLAFEELLLLELGMLASRPANAGGVKISDHSAAFASLLPFRMTNAQSRAVGEIMSDLSSGAVMRRLLQGDVGSGKTAVAASVVYSCVKSGYQAAMMAPTEVLAGQHFRTFLNFFDGTEIRVAALSGSMTKKSKDEVKKRLLSGEIDFVVGTHALIESDVEFRNLALVITDEQHRFGVEQRTALAEKGADTHMLVMSATPIPRTLGLIIYGDMDISVLDELPAGRKPIKTYRVPSSYRPRLYKFLEKHFSEGRQGYIICPMIEEGENSGDLIPAEDYYEYLKQQVFPNRRLGLVHGKLKASEKERTMADFAEGKLDLLVSTTVIEVGIDVPNATVMIVENADRFGLSQLHQLRGRVGRGKYESYCVLVSDNQNPDTDARLNIMCETNDGFKIADEDLRLRGPGDFFGERQHGLPLLKIADMMNDTAMLVEARKTAEAITADGGINRPENRALRAAVTELFGNDATKMN
ncbi:MAG: ATP-dependent DNA helicase RecG [Clostridia bacterium]|nr:ATP-dependent DNA helicase RecG [Clostridia bacterium]